MFHLKSQTRQNTAHSANWHESLGSTDVKKRIITKTHTVAYEPRTLAESIHKACMKSFGFSGEAEVTALKVCNDLEHWLVDKEEVTAADIKRRAAAALQKYNPRAAYEYLPVKEYQIHEDEYGFIRL